MSIHNFEYLLLLLVCFAVPFGISFIHRRVLRKENYHLVQPTILLAAIPFIAFDLFAVWRGYWRFNEKFILGISLLHLPLEELLFFILIPQSCLLLWVGLKKFHSLQGIQRGFLRHIARFKGL